MSSLLRYLLGLALTLAVSGRAADEIRLKGGALVRGVILAEKTDRVFVDLGYTVIDVPRVQIESLSRAKDVSKDDPATSAPKAAPARPGFFAEAARPGGDRSVRDLVAELGEAVVQVKTPGGLGSGFFINEEGYLITNFHVIEGETQISVEVYHQAKGQLNRRLYKDVRIVALTKHADLALLRIEDADAGRFARVPLGDSDALNVGDRVFAVGSPLGLERTVTEGIVSTKTRVMEGSLYLQTSTQINPGNSGGPLLNLRGEVVGVNNMKIAFGEGLAFAIPVQTVKQFLQHRDAFAYNNDNPSSAYRYLPPPATVMVPAATKAKPAANKAKGRKAP